MKRDNLVYYYKELLVRAVPENTLSISQCVLRTWLHEVGKYLRIDSMRLYLFDDRSNNYIKRQIYGEKEYWKDVDVTTLRKEKTNYRKLYFIKIRHVRENGQFFVLGYLAFHTEHYVGEDMLSSLDVLCMLYGNYIVKRLITGQYSRINSLLTKAYSSVASNERPGSKIRKLLGHLYGLSGFNYGLFCTVYGNTIFGEYIASSKGCSVLMKNPRWTVTDTLIKFIENNNPDSRINLSVFPKKIIDYIFYRDNRNPKSFSLQTIPVHVDGELIGLWLIVFSENNPFVDNKAHSVIEGVFPLLKDSYQYLFQRRFKSMIVNPIFQNRDTRVNQNSVFVIMPFTQEWSNDIWEQVLRPAIQEIGMIPLRADDLYGQNIMEDVWKSILHASIIICDTTDRNPNVFYELGIAHTLGKKVILLTQDMKDIPFDLRAYRHVKYDISISGGNQLKERVKQYITESLSCK